MLHAVCRVSRRFGLRPVGDDEDWTIFWTDTAVVLERVMDMKRYQVRISRVPALLECQKLMFIENQPLSWDGRNMQEGFSSSKHE